MTQTDTQTDDQDGPRIAQGVRAALTPATPRPGWWSRLWRRHREPEPPSILQIRAEWMEYQIAFNDLLTKFSALLARQAKAEKKRAEREAEADQHAPSGAPLSGKAALRSAVAQRMYGERIASIMNARNGSESE